MSFGSTFEATVADVKNGKTKLVVKFDAEEIERDQLANLNDMIGSNVEVIVRPRAVIVKEEEPKKGKEYAVNNRGEVDVAPGQMDVYDFVGEGDPVEEQSEQVSEEQSDTEEIAEEQPDEEQTENVDEVV